MTPVIPKPTVWIEEAGDEWVVRVAEGGKTRVEAFILEAFAMSFAEGQRIRLGLQKVERRYNE